MSVSSETLLHSYNTRRSLMCYLCIRLLSPLSVRLVRPSPPPLTSPHQQLIFGYEFNRPIAQMKEWPATLLLLSFGHAFNQSLDGVSLPRCLEFLEFGHEFNQSLQRVALPDALRHLRFFHCFNHPLVGVVWPVSLRHVWLCGTFVQPVRDVDWPPGLRVLALPHRYREAAAEGDVLLPYGCRLQLVGCG